MHFTPAVPAGRELCAGMGTAITAVVKTLVPGVVEGTTTIRGGLGSTSACGATCCAAEAECLAEEQAACAAERVHRHVGPALVRCGRRARGVLSY